jgi:hypothetical protein
MAERDETDAEIGALVLSPLEIVAPFFGATGIFTAIVARIASGGLSAYLSRRGARRLHAFVERFAKNVDDRVDELETRLAQVEQAEHVTGMAVRAAIAAGTSGARPAHRQTPVVLNLRGRATRGRRPRTGGTQAPAGQTPG